MGCPARITITGGSEQLIDDAYERLHDLDRRWTRFDPDSELMVLARARGRAVALSTESRMLVNRLVEAWHATSGVFDPTLLPALLDAGYVSSVLDGRRVSAVPLDSEVRVDLSDVFVDDEAGTAALPRGATLDSGGLGKGLAADLVVEELRAKGAAGALVEIGGDLRVSGEAPSGHWRIDVTDPSGGPRLALVELLDGGVATSSIGHGWVAHGHPAHHLIDPRTGAPTTSDVVAATVVAGTAAWAEVFSKVPVVLGSAAGTAVLESHALPALLLLDDGSTRRTSAWSEVAS